MLIFSKNFQNFFKSSPNWLKFGKRVRCYILIAILTFIFSNFFPFIFFGKIWSQNLKLFILTEISYRRTLVYAYYDFNVYFFKTLFIHIFEQICSQNLKSFKLIKIWYRGRFLKAYIDLMFIFSKFLSFIFFGQIWSQNLKFSKLTEIWDKRTFLYAC